MKSIVKKICIYTICTCLIFTSVFISYDNTIDVYAIDESQTFDAVRTIVGMAAALAGIVSIVGTGGLSAPGVIALSSGVLTTIDGAQNLYHYFTDNGDGTFTMTPEFIQLVINEAQKIDETGFHDFESIQNPDGTYNILGYDSMKKIGGEIADRRYHDTSSGKVLAYVASDGGYVLNTFSFRGNAVDFSSFNCYYDEYWNGEIKYHGNSNWVGGTLYTSWGVNVPVFSTLAEAEAAFRSGDYSGAINYREKYFDYSNRYAPAYPGGSVRISKEKLDGFEDKLNEVYNNYDDVNDRVDALYEYIFGDNIFGNNGGFDFDIDSPFDLGDWFSGIFNDPFGLGEEIINSLAGFFSDIANGLKKKFPFSIPWDIYKVFTVFSNVQSPQPASISPLSFSDQGEMQVLTGDIQVMADDVHDAPYFKLPIKVESFGIEEEIIVDMKDFQTLSTFSRTMFSLLFAVVLLKFTLKILSIFGVFGGGGDSD